MIFQKRQPYRNKKILQAARGEDCTANFPGCNYNPETTVACHLNESFAGKGISQKADDDAMFFGCSHCHDLYDGRRYLPDHEQADWDQSKYFYLLRAVIRTKFVLRDKGLLDGN